jgi:hypothetical protein
MMGGQERMISKMDRAGAGIDGQEAASVRGESWDEARPDNEQRSEPRFTLLIRTAKLIAPSGEFLCIVRDASREGFKVRIFNPVPPDEPLEIEFANGERQPVRKVWQEGDAAGFRFFEPVEIERLLAESPAGLRKRAVRLRLAVPTLVIADNRRRIASFLDISQHGACIECAEHLAMDQRVTLDCDWLPPLVGRVRWRRQPRYGVIFEQTFRLDELARLTAPLQAAPAEAPPSAARLRWA